MQHHNNSLWKPWVEQGFRQYAGGQGGNKDYNLLVVVASPNTMHICHTANGTTGAQASGGYIKTDNSTYRISNYGASATLEYLHFSSYVPHS